MGKRISVIVLAALFVFAMPGIAQAYDGPYPLEPVTVLWDGTGAANLPCPAGAHWTFDQGVVEGNGIYNTTIHLGPDGYAGWGMAFTHDPAIYPRGFESDTVFPLDAETYVDYSYTSEESAEFLADDHLVLANCLSSEPPPPPPPPTCTRIIGLSFTSQWFPTFETQVGTASWELFWHHGARVNFWSRLQWGGSHYDSACTVSPITRVVYDFSPETNQGPDVTALVVKLRQVVANLQAKFPGAQVVLQPIIGGPGHQYCYKGGKVVNATTIHIPALDAINQVADGTTVVMGLDAHVSDCSMFKDTVGHFTPTGATYIAGLMGAFYG